MKLRLILAAATIATAFAGTVHADSFMNGNQLYESCFSEKGVDEGMCYGYVSGVVDSVKAVGNCMTPFTVQLDQVRDVVKKYLQSYPENRPYSANSLVVAAVKQAFCK